MRTITTPFTMMMLTIWLAACGSSSQFGIAGFGGREKEKDAAGDTASNGSDQEPGRPSDEGEGFPGYLTDPYNSIAVVPQEDGSLVVRGKNGTYISFEATPDDRLETWQVKTTDLASASIAVGNTVIAATHIASITPKEDGSFEQNMSAPAEDQTLVITVGGDTTSSAITLQVSSQRDRSFFFVYGAAMPSFVPQAGIWLALEDVQALELNGPAWDYVNAEAALNTAHDLQTINNDANTETLAAAIVYAATGDKVWYDKVVKACNDVMGTEVLPNGETAKTLVRGLPAYIYAADLVGYKADVAPEFAAWLQGIQNQKMDNGRTLAEMQRRAGGVEAGATRIAIALYLADQATLADAAQIFRGWLGQTDSHTFANIEAGTWLPENINEIGPLTPLLSAKATIEGKNVSGALPDQLAIDFPTFALPLPSYAFKSWNTLQGATATAEVLWRAGYDAFAWQEQGLGRAVAFLQENGSPASDESDEEWILWLINKRTGATWGVPEQVPAGKVTGFTDFTHR